MKVKITKASKPSYWYSDKIGKIFEVDLFDPETNGKNYMNFLGKGYTLCADGTRHIKEKDCVAIHENPTQEKIEIMQAYSDGKPIQARRKGRETWNNTKTPIWDWQGYDYKVGTTDNLLWEVISDNKKLTPFSQSFWVKDIELELNVNNTEFYKTGRFFNTNTKQFGEIK